MLGNLLAALLPAAPLFASAVGMEEALRSVRARPGGLSLPADLSEDPFRIESSLILLREPLSAPERSRDAAEEFLKAASPARALELAAGRLGPDLPAPRPPAEAPALPGLPEPWGSVLGRLAAETARAQERIDEALAGLPRAVREELLDFLRLHVTDGMPDPARLRPDETWHERDEALLRAAGSVPLAGLLAAARDLLAAIQAAREALAGAPAPARGHPPVLSAAGSRIAVGTPGPDVFEEPADVLVDPGGDDVYRPAALRAVPGRARVVLDLGGDDYYLSRGFGGAGAGLLGVGVLWDAGGDDVHSGEDAGQGAALLGAGVLVDEGGNDLYAARAFAQGAAAFGAGLLLDGGGADVYRASYLSQGTGYVAGVGALRDLSGNDLYASGFSVPDPRGFSESYGEFRQGEVFQSLSQGFGLGWRDMAGGGIGLLVDGAGNDRYLADYFGQGAGYWFGWGLLYDAAGNDSYVARRYAQGAGIHLAAGVLIDVAGNDRYQSWAVSQALGHDYALGVLVDGAGADDYVGSWSVMGFSNAQGLGLFRDQAGADRYAFQTAHGASGAFDDKRRGAGVGLFLDSGPGRNAFAVEEATRAWNAGPWGAGLAWTGPFDWSVGLPAPPAGEVPASYGERERREGEFLLERLRRAPALGERARLAELLAVASGWGLNGAVPMEAKRRLLAEAPSAVLPHLKTLNRPPGIFSRLNLEEYLLSAAPGSRASLEALASDAGLPEAQRARALHYLGRLRTPEALPALLAWARDPSWRLRAAAARGLGDLCDRELRGKLEDLAAAIGKGDREAVVRGLQGRYKYEGLWLLRLRESAARGDFVAAADGLSSETMTARAAEAAAELLLREPEVLDRAAGVLQARPQALSALRELLRDKRSDVRRWALHALARAGEPAQTLAPALGDPDYAVRESAAWELRRRGEEAARALAAQLRSEDPLRRALAARASGPAPGRKAVRELTRLLADPDAGVRLAALQALAEARRAPPRRRLKALGRKDADPWVRGLAIELLKP